MSKHRRYRQRVPLPDLVIWTGVFVFLAFFGALYASVRNSHILTGNETRKLEIRLEQLQQDVASMELVREQLLEPAALERRLRRMNSSLRPIDPGQLVTLPLEPPGDPLLARMLSGDNSGDELPDDERGGWTLLPRTPILKMSRTDLPDPHNGRLMGAGFMLERALPQAAAKQLSAPPSHEPPSRTSPP